MSKFENKKIAMSGEWEYKPRTRKKQLHKTYLKKGLLSKTHKELNKKINHLIKNEQNTRGLLDLSGKSLCELYKCLSTICTPETNTEHQL